MAAGAWLGQPMASLIMAVTVLLWVALTVPGWAVQAMAAPVHTVVVLVVVLVVAAQAMAAPVLTAVLVAAAQAMAAPVPTAVLAAAVRGMVDPVLTAVPVVAILAVQAAARAMAVMAAGARAHTSQTKVSFRRAA
jgi:hypothetical protein